MTIVHCTTVHVRTDTRIFRKECSTLAQRLADVYLVVGDGLGDRDDAASGLRIRDIGAVPGGTRLGRMLWQPLRLWRLVRALKPQLVHVHDPELLPVAMLLRWGGAKVVYDIHEDLPKQILTKHWIAPWLRTTLARAVRAFEDAVSARLSALVTATPAITDRFRRLNPLTITVNNYPIAEELLSLDASDAARRHVCYVGGITRIRGISVLLEALALVPGLRLQLCGPFESADYERELRQHPAWSQVDYLGVVDRVQMRHVLDSSFAGLVTFLPAPNHVEAQPQKVFEYMSAGVPVIGSDFDLWRRVIADTGAGLCVDPSDPASIAAAMRRLRDDEAEVAAMGRRGKALVQGELNWTHEADKLVALYRQLGVAGA